MSYRFIERSTYVAPVRGDETGTTVHHEFTYVGWECEELPAAQEISRHYAEQTLSPEVRTSLTPIKIQEQRRFRLLGWKTIGCVTSADINLLDALSLKAPLETET
jgi:hypothetical protein